MGLTMAKKYILVETIQQYKLTYAFEVPEGVSIESATLTAESAVGTPECIHNTMYPKEFTQIDLGETILGSRAIPKEELLAICDTDNEYAVVWTEQQKENAFVN